MRRFTLVALSLLLVAISFGFRGGYWRGEHTVAGAHTFEDATDFNAVVDLNDASLWVKGDSLFFTDGSADTSSVVQNGDYLYFNTDNNFCFNGTIFTANLQPSDTLSYVGGAAVRYKEVWGLRLMWSDGAQADSGKISDNGTYTIIATDNAAYFTNPLTGTDSMLNGETQDTIVNTVFGTAAHITITPLETWGSATEWWITTTQDTVFVNVDANPAATISYKWVLVKP